MRLLTRDASVDEKARAFCIDISREYTIRAGHHKPSNGQERRWLAEGLRPIHLFDTFISARQ